MNWFKKKINELFHNDNEQYDAYEEYEEENFEEYEEEQPTERKSSFRFPLIADEEIIPSAMQQSHKTKTAPAGSGEEKPLELPKHLQYASSKVYDVEVQGIRDLLEQRQQRTGHSNVLRSPAKSARKLSVRKEEPELPPKKPVLKEKEVDREFINPLENRKRFVPTEVPSPVYGFKKPKPIEQLMAKKQAETASVTEETPIVHEDKDNVELTQPLSEREEYTQLSSEREQAVISVETKMYEEKASIEAAAAILDEPYAKTINLTMEETEEDTPVEADSAIYEENDSLIVLETIEDTVTHQSEEEPIQAPVTEVQTHEAEEGTDALSEVQVKHVKIENSTIHIGQLNVEQAQQNEFVQMKNEEQKPASPGSRLPFNVLMLKSDKEKLLAKEILQEQLRTKEQEIQKIDNAPSEPTVRSAPQVQEEKSSVQLSSMDKEIALESASNTVAVLEREEPAPEAEHIVEITEKEKQSTDELSKGQIEEPEKMMEAPSAVLLKEEETVHHQARDVNRLLQAAAEEQAEVVQELPVKESSIQNSQEFVEAKAAVVPEEQPEPKFSRHYEKPPLSFLAPPEEKTEDWAWMDEQGERLIMALSYFHIDAEIVSIVQGPAVTQFEITVAHGTKVSKVRGLADDIKLALAARDIRIDAPIPGKHSIGIEIPNRVSRAVRLSEVTDSEGFQTSESPLEAALGLDLTGQPVTIDLRKMPHGLIAGATGSGKSVCINSILVSLLYKADPHELKLMLIDPKMVELAPFNHIPHLVSPVITDVKAATAALKWAVEEMERRYQLFMHAGVRDITRFNQQAEKTGQYAQKMPYILIVIDELADLMMMSPADVEEAICRIAQKARACGIHLIVATQRPSVDVITGLIKSNIPTRIAFAVSSSVDSRTILDMQGAERLLGRGDMLYLGNGMPAPVRLQGTFVTDDEIEDIIAYVRDQGEPEYMFEHDELLKKAEVIEEQDELFEEVCRYVFEQGTASTSSIQRRYKIGYNRAARLVDMLERHGFVSEQKGSKPRDVFITESDIISMFE
ncbi:DNA translocase FtsK [Lysinibacillus odysseyi]|uniref:FtsK domain-containing protein n=1 Tax=Lysinibacillus odysseyi 34hs-1 = NBRC 100172 TaxID=1220589 RepID=A0A0A3ISY7_9BACI|nr:DNA translocase FtsK [Lysinibacillus odysseyi]KGR87791.1 hypothetical protein CD32_03045 [Lysinibacillus odysseyi 34hs-1 = NBRC 100172]